MGCSGSKGACGALEPRRRSVASAVPFDDTFASCGDEAMMKAGNAAVGVVGKLLGRSRSLGGWKPPPPPPKQRRLVAARVEPPTTTKAEKINLWEELMKRLHDEEGEDGGDDDDDQVFSVERKAPGTPVFDPEILGTFRRAIEFESPLPTDVGAEKREIQTGIVSVLQEQEEEASAPPPDSAGRVVVYLTSLRGIRKTYDDCRSTSALLRGYGVLVDERDVWMHAGFIDELRAALGGGRAPRLPQLFADGRHLGGAEEISRLHEDGDLEAALGACDGAQDDACDACVGVRFLICGACSGSCNVLVEDDGNGHGAFRRRFSECNENGLVRCPVC
ncbi:unnamed protein product [Urochloa decumbens]|uniref:Glutaredoxin domain-containing protein n=1 Tax=Urochloa decumbens TaxID=240449 RepID=A0ABC9BCA9_9POAL